MDGYFLKVNISVMRAGFVEPVLHREEFEGGSRHKLIHECRLWVAEVLSRYLIEDKLDPAVIEAVTAGKDLHQWYSGDDLTLKVRITRE
jgi:hypothetical protein